MQILFANRAACALKLKRFDDAQDDCSIAIRLGIKLAALGRKQESKADDVEDKAEEKVNYHACYFKAMYRRALVHAT